MCELVYVDGRESFAALGGFFFRAEIPHFDTHAMLLLYSVWDDLTLRYISSYAAI